MSNQRCETCVFADFPRTPTGRIKKHESGRCLVVIPPPAPVPDCIPEIYRPRDMNGLKGGIGPEFGTTCTFWRAK